MSQISCLPPDEKVVPKLKKPDKHTYYAFTKWFKNRFKRNYCNAVIEDINIFEAFEAGFTKGVANED